MDSLPEIWLVWDVGILVLSPTSCFNSLCTHEWHLISLGLFFNCKMGIWIITAFPKYGIWIIGGT